jgi:hypothetical protein
MAQSPSHKFGQIIGTLLEEMLRAPLAKVARRHGLYLDFRHPRPARGNKRKVTWTDHRGNDHELDYVLEHGGSEKEKGTPKAFIECAWRRYTKHSRNKAQEIQGAVSVLAETYSSYNPFLGVVLAGVFTEGSLQQLRSHGFSMVYCPYEAVVKAFSRVGIDADFDEDTSDRQVQAKVGAYQALGNKQRSQLVTTLKKLVRNDLNGFLAELETTLTRRIERIFIATLHGATFEAASVNEAVELVEKYKEDGVVHGFVRYEVDIKYTNGDRINGQFEDKPTAISFLRKLG